MTPYYDLDGQITIYHGDCRVIVPNLAAAVDTSLVLTDPPYGISWNTDYAGRGMGQLTQSNTFAPVHQDNEPFDPAPWLVYPKAVLFGANHYADKLPPSAGWIVWDKDLGLNTSDLSDAELAWTNVTGGVRVFRHLWKGMLKDSERTEKRVHPTQKPVALMRWILEKWTLPGDLILDPYMGSGPVAKAWTLPGDLILDPYMGSGPVAKACYEMGRQYIGVEIEERYCEIAVHRLAQGVLEFG